MFFNHSIVRRIKCSLHKIFAVSAKTVFVEYLFYAKQNDLCFLFFQLNTIVDGFLTVFELVVS